MELDKTMEIGFPNLFLQYFHTSEEVQFLQWYMITHYWFRIYIWVTCLSMNKMEYQGHLWGGHFVKLLFKIASIMWPLLWRWTSDTLLQEKKYYPCFREPGAERQPKSSTLHFSVNCFLGPIRTRQNWLTDVSIISWVACGRTISVGQTFGRAR